jgi:hypothetical protein
LPRTAQKRNETLPIFILDVGMFKCTEEILIDLEVVIAPILQLLIKKSDSEGIEFVDMCVQIVCAELAHV